MIRKVWAAGAASAALVISTVAAMPPTASAAPACATLPPGVPTKVAQISGWAESMAVDDTGRMFVTNLTNGRVYRIDRPGATPVALTGNVQATGGILLRPDGKLLVGTQNQGAFITNAKILLVDPDTGGVSTYASGLQGIDGIALAPDGTVYTTTVFATAIGRVTPDGSVNPTWAKVPSPNGIAVSPDNKYVYVIQTAPAPALYRIPVEDPSHPTAIVSAGLADVLALPDGLTLDSQGRPLIATHAAGQIWRVENGRFCTVQGNQLLSTQVTYGHGSTGFSAGRLFRTGIDGGIYEIPAGFDPGGQ